MFETSRTTLLSHNDSMLAKFLSFEEAKCEESGAERPSVLFIDRNGDYFAPILGYLRSGELILDGLSPPLVRREADFYGLPALVKLLDHEMELTRFLSLLSDRGQCGDKTELPPLSAKGLQLNRNKFINADLRHIDFAGANFSCGILWWAQFSFSDLSYANFEDSHLFGAKMECTLLVNANFMGANLEKVIFKEANLDKARLRGAILRSVVCTAAKFTNADMCGVSWTNAQCNGSYFTGANLKSADLSDTTLINANLQDAILLDASLARVNLRGASLAGANLKGADFSNVLSLQNVRWEDVDTGFGDRNEKTKIPLRYKEHLPESALPGVTWIN